MKSFAFTSLALVAGTLCFLNSTRATDAISLESLLSEMVDRQAVARFPSPAYVCRQSSSYDRDSVSPDNNETWFANWDRSQFIRIDETAALKEYVLHDSPGPGALVRIWMTWHGPGGGEFSNGTLRVYIDGQDTPAIEGPVSQVVDQGLLAGPPLSQGVSPQTPYAQRGHNLYLPIPYAKHCKVTYSADVPVDRGARQGEALYYQINYRTYDSTAHVESFSMERLKAAQPAIASVNKRLAAGMVLPQADWLTVQRAAEIAPDSASTPIRLAGARAIRALQCQLTADDLEQALRSTVLEINFDGADAVWCPIGEFFGTGYKLRPHQTWYTRVEKNGVLACSWVMPFQREATITIHNYGPAPIHIDTTVSHDDWLWDDRSLHFHSAWRQFTQAETPGNQGSTSPGAHDLNYVTINGQGVYVGDTLTVSNGAAAWWGEGDEKIYVDGEEFPSHFGTGTEDYYGYAWCRPEFFEAPFHAQPDGGGNLAGGYSVNCRYRSLDAIPFTRSLQVDMELWHWAKTRINYAPTTRWYARPGATTAVEPDPVTVAKPVARERSDIVPIFRVAGAIEGESLRVAERTGGTPQVQHGPFGWSNEAQLWWIDGQVRDRLVVEFPVRESGRYVVFANLTKAADYAIVSLSVNDGPQQAVDCFHPEVSFDLVDLGTFDLQKGANRLNVEITGVNPEAIPRRMFGLDYVKLERR